MSKTSPFKQYEKTFRLSLNPTRQVKENLAQGELPLPNC